MKNQKKKIYIQNLEITNKCIANNYLKLKHISILQIINHNMLKKINHNN